MLRRLLALAIVCCFPASYAAEVYRWIDADGVVNYTQQKPRDIAVQHLTTSAGAPTRVREQPASAPVEQPEKTDTMTDSQQRMLEGLQAKEQARQDEIARVRQENCSKSRSVLSNLSAKERIRVRDDNGRERMMAEDERQRRISEAQQGIVQNCASA
jgi:hypothetical protein